MTTRFPNGLTTTTKASKLGEFILPDMTKAHVYFNDFDTYNESEWIITKVGVVTTAFLFDGDGGLLTLLIGSTDGENIFLQKLGDSFLMQTGKKAWFEAKFQISDALQSNFVIGLQITDATPLDVTDGIFFIKADGFAAVDFIVEKDSTATQTSGVATIVNDTDIRLGFFYDGVDKIVIFVDGVAVNSSVITNLPDDEVLTISFGIQNGEAASKTMILDYILAAKER